MWCLDCRSSCFRGVIELFRPCVVEAEDSGGLGWGSEEGGRDSGGSEAREGGGERDGEGGERRGVQRERTRTQ